MPADMRTPSHSRNDQRENEGDEKQAEHSGVVTTCAREGNRCVAAFGEQASPSLGLKLGRNLDIMVQGPGSPGHLPMLAHLENLPTDFVQAVMGKP